MTDLRARGLRRLVEARDGKAPPFAPTIVLWSLPEALQLLERHASPEPEARGLHGAFLAGRRAWASNGIALVRLPLAQDARDGWHDYGSGTVERAHPYQETTQGYRAFTKPGLLAKPHAADAMALRALCELAEPKGKLRLFGGEVGLLVQALDEENAEIARWGSLPMTASPTRWGWEHGAKVADLAPAVLDSALKEARGQVVQVAVTGHQDPVLVRHPNGVEHYLAGLKMTNPP